MVHQLEQQFLPRSKCPILEPRFSVLKQQLIKQENKQKVIQSYDRLCQLLRSEVDLIAKNGPAMIPEIDFKVVVENGGALPEGLADLVRDRGCVIFRNVVPQEEAEAWAAQMKDYTKRHHTVGGFPKDNPQTWSLYWTKSQVQIRSHPKVLSAMKAISTLWHVEDTNAEIDLASQVVYPDRFRIRSPSKEKEFTLNAHLDSGSIERWEDPTYRACYERIFAGDWENYDAWSADLRSIADMDLYATGSSCSCWRSMQGWISLSHTGTGEGTLRLLPNLKASTAYMMLQPFFVDGTFDDITASFPGARPGNTQFHPTKDLHPHLELEKSIVGIPPVKPGDYVFWHADLIHEVDKLHPGTTDSIAVYNACTPLTPYNLSSLVSTRASFQAAEPPKDFNNIGAQYEEENQHDDHGAQKEYILSDVGLRAMGFLDFDENEVGITEGQRRMRRIANQTLQQAV